VEPIKSKPDASKSLSQLKPVLDRLSLEGTVVARADGSSHRVFPVAVTPDEGEVLRGWVARERAETTIEIGLGYGVAALHVCAGLIDAGTPEPRHVVLDPYQRARFSDVGLQLLDEAGVADLVEFHPRASEFALPSFLEQGRSFDVAVVDGNHRFDGVFLDLWYLGRLLRPAGIAFLDDYQLPGVARATSFFVTNVGWRVEEVSPADDLHQWVVLRTPATPDERSFEHFVDF
jgi:predicted O-methyltransferase YrrM